MRAVALLVPVLVVALGSRAAADTKELPPRLAQAAGEAFRKAQAADDRGDLDAAAKLYEHAIAIAPHPNTVFNLADVQRRARDLDDAIRSYERYLELAPDASDRTAVRALIAQLRATPGTLEIELASGEANAHVFVNGRYAGLAPIEVPAPKGIHQIDIVTPITFGQMACPVSTGGRRDCRVHAKPRVDGNVVLSGSRLIGGKSWPVGDQRFRMKGRFTARPGHYELDDVVSSQCKPLQLDVPRGDVVTYVYVTLPEERTRAARCREVSITQQRVKL